MFLRGAGCRNGALRGSGDELSQTKSRRRPQLARVGGRGNGRRRAPGGGGELSVRRLLGAHLPAVYPERRETVAGECLG